MNHTLSLDRDLSSVEVRDYFLLDSTQDAPDITDRIAEVVSKTGTRLCAILSNPDKDTVRLILSSRARKYIIVDDINNKNVGEFVGECIVREVPHISGNLIISDSDAALVFDDSHMGFVLSGKKQIESLSRVFIKWFWELATAEQIENTLVADNNVMVVPPLETVDSVLIGYSDRMKKLLKDPSQIWASGKRSSYDKNVVRVFSKIPDLEMLRSLDDPVYAPRMSMPFVINGSAYVLNFDPGLGDTTPKEARNLFWAIRVDELIVGPKYRFVRKSARKELLGKEVLDNKGRTLEMHESIEINKTIPMDLSEYYFSKSLEPSRLEERLEKSHPEVFASDELACNLKIHIQVEIKEHSIKSKDGIYDEHEKRIKQISQKLDELRKAYHSIGDKSVPREVDAMTISESGNFFDHIAEIDALNKAIVEFNNPSQKLDQDLLEVVGSKKPVQKRSIFELAMKQPKPLPAYGVLYSSGNRYEYVLNDESQLENAINESEANGRKEITYHLR